MKPTEQTLTTLRTESDALGSIEHVATEAHSIQPEIKALADTSEPAIKLDLPVTQMECGKHAQAEQLVQLALELCRLGQTPKREPFAVMRAGTNVAGRLGGSGGLLRDILAREYHRRFGKVMNATSYSDAVATLRGEALEAPTEAVYIRVGPYREGIVLDLGTADGAAVVADAQGWRIVERSPILFHRTALIGVLPRPIHGRGLDALRQLLNVTDETWPILLGWMVSALIPDMPHPILMVGGLQGTGKSTTGRFICGTFDPSDAPTRSQPRDPEAWAMSVANSWASVIDNVSSIPDWWSDALCKVVTGDGWIRRTLYSDGDVSVLSFRRVIALTSIDAGALRGDLGERLLLVELEPIAPEHRRTEQALNEAYRVAHPEILGALLDLLAAVLGRLASVRVPKLPRMADFARVLAAVDATLGTDSLTLYAEQGKRIAGEVLDADPVGEVVATWVRTHGDWAGTASALLTALKPEGAGREWPRNGRGMAATLKRLASALELQAVRVTPPGPTDHTRVYRLQAIAQSAQPPCSSPDALALGSNGSAVDSPTTADPSDDRPTGSADILCACCAPGRSGDPGDSRATLNDNGGGDGCDP